MKKYLLYDKKGEVRTIYHQEPPRWIVSNFEGLIEYDGDIEKKGYKSNITVDTETLEVTVEFEEIVDEAKEIEVLKNQINVLSDTLDFILVQGGVE